VSESNNDETAASAGAGNISVPQGWEVFASGTIGSLLGIVPALMLLPGAPTLPSPWKVVLPICWACFVGWPVTYIWSAALHKRIAALRSELIAAEALTLEERKQYPGRVPWMPAWIGLFERALYCLLIGLDVAGGATFIGVWVGIKLAGGWQVWSKGTTYGRAILFAGLLGNAMSVLFGVVAGLATRS
jgi:hypothetical protein